MSDHFKNPAYNEPPEDEAGDYRRITGAMFQYLSKDAFDGTIETRFYSHSGKFLFTLTHSVGYVFTEGEIDALEEYLKTLIKTLRKEARGK